VNGYVNAVSQINPDALHDAAALDSERASGDVRGLVARVRANVRDLSSYILPYVIV
jgi:hypothetical protein